MSRVHDALRKAEKGMAGGVALPPDTRLDPRVPRPPLLQSPVSMAAVAEPQGLEGLIDMVAEIPFAPSENK